MDDYNSGRFQFNEKLDIAFLNDLFEGDMQYATVIFGDFLKTLPSYWLEIEEAYHNNKISELRSAVHKTKTLFGYVGHTPALESFQSFENYCDVVKDKRELAGEFIRLGQIKDAAHKIIGEEYERLKQYHQ